jgi:hypothetical protein
MAEDAPVVPHAAPTGTGPDRRAVWVIAMLCFAGLFASLYALFFYAIPDNNRDLIVLLVGSFVTNASAIVTALVRLRTGKDPT